MTTLNPIRVEGGEFSADDRRHIAAAASRIDGDESIPAAVRQIAVALLDRIAEGQSIELVDPDDVLSPNQAANLVGVSRPLLNRLLDDGRIPFFTTEGGHRKIKRRDVTAYIEDRDKIADQLAQARQSRRSANEEVAGELGLSPEQAKRLGLV